MIPTIPADRIIFAMDKAHPPVLRVKGGSRVRFLTCDCFSNQIQTAQDTFDYLDWNRINPATGPLFVEGAQPGDTLAVHIRAIRVDKQGVLATLPGAGVAGGRLKESRIDLVAVEDGHITLFDRVRLPLNVMIGVIGTAPAGGAVSCGTPDAHGGNMDSKVITAGTTLFLPVNAEGALLAMGDLHAAMGDGEVGVSGLEVAGEVEVEVRVIKGRPWPLPALLSDTHLYTLASHADLDEAAERATLMMTEILTSYGKLDTNQAIALQSLAGDVQVSQIVDPHKTCRYALPRGVLEQLGVELL